MTGPSILDDLSLGAAALANGLSFADAIALERAFEAGVPNLSAMDKAGTLDSTLAEVLRVGVVLAKLLKDPNERATTIALVDQFMSKF